ncbi:MAG TPA: ribbon-helix-helix domain-containing protein [Gemmatimonadales bacterium]
MSNSAKTTVYLNVDDYAELKRLAAEGGRTAAELVRAAVADYVRRVTGEPDAETARRLALFDAASARVPDGHPGRAPGTGRGWTRDELYRRGNAD